MEVEKIIDDNDTVKSKLLETTDDSNIKIKKLINDYINLNNPSFDNDLDTTVIENDEDNENESIKSSIDNNSNIAVANDLESNAEFSDVESINNDNNSNDKFFVTNMKTKEELESESKLITEKEIYNLGISQAIKIKEEKEFDEKFKKLKNLIEDNEYLKDVNSFIEDIISNKKYLLLQTTLNNHIDYISILNSIINKNEKNIKILNQDKKDLDTQVDDLFDETEKLNDEISKNEKRITNLRNKCISKNQKFKLCLYLSVFLNINSYLIGNIGFINYFKRIYQYSLDIYNIFYFILTNFTNYTILFLNNKLALYVTSGLFISFKIYLIFFNKK